MWLLLGVLQLLGVVAVFGSSQTEPRSTESEEFDVPPPPPQLLAHRLTLIMSELLGEDILEAFGWMQGRATVFATEGDPDSDGEELRDLFAVLGLAQSASEDEVRAAWKEQVAKERAAFTSTSTDGDAFGRVRLLNRARDILVDDSKRKTYIFLRDFQKEDGDFAQEFRADRDRQMQQQQEQQRYLQQEQQRYLMAQQQQQQQQQRMLQQQQYAYYQQQQQQQQRQHSPRSADYGMFRRHTRYDSSDSSSEDSKDSTDGAVYFTPRVSAAAPSSARNTRYTASQRAQPVTASHVRQASAEHLRRTTQARLRRQGTASPMAHSQAEEGALRQEHLRLLHNVRARLRHLFVIAGSY
ncbi:MAG: hypothetical protein MHM6MM_005780 [Cercozoa sp. M6MM]